MVQANNLNTVNGVLEPVGNRVLVTDMYFGEQKTNSGLIISSDNGKTRGVYPRWARVHKKCPDNNDPYNIGDWVLVEHGRWTRGIKINEGDGETVVRMIEAEAVMIWSDEKPDNTFTIGKEFDDMSSFDIDPQTFINN